VDTRDESLALILGAAAMHKQKRR